VPQFVFSELFVHYARPQKIINIATFYLFIVLSISLSLSLILSQIFIRESNLQACALAVGMALSISINGIVRPICLASRYKIWFDVLTIVPTFSFSAAYLIALILGNQGPVVYRTIWAIYAFSMIIMSTFASLCVAKDLRENPKKSIKKLIAKFAWPSRIFKQDMSIMLRRITAFSHCLYPFFQGLITLLIVKLLYSSIRTLMGPQGVSWMGNSLVIYALLLSPMLYIAPKLALKMIESRNMQEKSMHDNCKKLPLGLAGITGARTVGLYLGLCIFGIIRLNLVSTIPIQFIFFVGISFFGLIPAAARNLLIIDMNSRANLLYGLVSELFRGCVLLIILMILPIILSLFQLAPIMIATVFTSAYVLHECVALLVSVKLREVLI